MGAEGNGSTRDEGFRHSYLRPAPTILAFICLWAATALAHSPDDDHVHSCDECQGELSCGWSLQPIGQRHRHPYPLDDGDVSSLGCYIAAGGTEESWNRALGLPRRQPARNPNCARCDSLNPADARKYRPGDSRGDSFECGFVCPSGVWSGTAESGYSCDGSYRTASNSEICFLANGGTQAVWDGQFVVVTPPPPSNPVEIETAPQVWQEPMPQVESSQPEGCDCSCNEQGKDPWTE